MAKDIKNVSDLFTLDFFTKLKDFIFDENFDNFYNRKLKDKSDYVGYDDSIWYPIEEDMKTSNIYPINYDKFMDMYQNIGSCTCTIDNYLFNIKYLIFEIFEKDNSKYLNNGYISIKLNKKIVVDQYISFFEQSFSSLTISKLLKYYIFNKNNVESMDFLARKIICYIFEYIQSYLETIINKLVEDNKTFCKTYSLETQFEMLNKTRNKNSDEIKNIKEIREFCKKERNQRLFQAKGKPKPELIGYFPYNYKKLAQLVKQIKEEYNNYPDVKKELRNIHKGDDVKLAKEKILNYFKNIDDEELYITLDDDEVRKITGHKGIINGASEILLKTLEIYVEIKCGVFFQNMDFYPFGIEDIIKYTLLKDSGNLNLYQPDFNILKGMRNDLSNRKNDKYFYTPIEVNPIYKSPEFITKYNKFFRY